MGTPKRNDKIIKTETTSMLIDVLEPYLVEGEDEHLVAYLKENKS
jgi:hypothetical protein